MPRRVVALFATVGALTAGGEQVMAQGGGGGGLTATEFAAGGVAALARRQFWGAGLGVARRVSGQTRFGLGAAGGSLSSGQGPTLRVEATGQFLVSPALRAGVGLYGGAGLAWQGGKRTPGAGYLTVLLGLESAPGRRSGWYAELGLGGGVRLAAGWRWRRFPAWWPR